MIKLRLVRFSNFRQRLLFWFILFLSSNLVVIALAMSYLQKRDKIAQTVNAIEVANGVFLESMLAQQYFFSYETKNALFFQTSESDYLDKYSILKDSAFALMNQVDQIYPAFHLGQEVDSLVNEFERIDSIFQVLVLNVRQRGYKDFSLEGQMRAEAHWLEGITEIPIASILSLRRHEKDYIIRNELGYAQKLNELAEALKRELRLQVKISSLRRDTIITRLTTYQNKFNELVALDRLSGIKDNTARKGELDYRIQEVEEHYATLIQKADSRKKQLFIQLNTQLISVLAILLIGSIILSTFIASRITFPLTELTVYITKFIDSNFTLTSDHPIIQSKDEIGKLTQNFTVLKEEIITRLKFFKQKVEERTEELAIANTQLKRLNEANSRFVPNEFLQFLGKKSIEEVKLGDHTEGEMTIMFTDIRSFTKISEGLSPQENFDFINQYLNAIVPIIRNNDGIIDKYIGDSVMALFPKGANAALQAAYEFEDALIAFNETQKSKDLEPIQIGVGIHRGSMILGTIGHDQRLETTVISDAVNIASRVEGLTKTYQAKIIATEAIVNKLDKNHPFFYRVLGKVHVQGKSKEITVFEFLSGSDTLKLSYQEQYQEVMDLFEMNRKQEALKVLNRLKEINPADKAIQLLINQNIN